MVTVRQRDLQARIADLDPFGSRGACLRFGDLPMEASSGGPCGTMDYARCSGKRASTFASGRALVDVAQLTRRSMALRTQGSELRPRCARRSGALAALLGPQERVGSRRGGRWSRRDLLRKAVDLEPNSARARNDLAVDLDPGEQIQLADGTVRDAKELLIDALRIEPSSACIYDNLRQVWTVEGLQAAVQTVADLGKEWDYLETTDGRIADGEKMCRSMEAPSQEHGDGACGFGVTDGSYTPASSSRVALGVVPIADALALDTRAVFVFGFDRRFSSQLATTPRIQAISVQSAANDVTNNVVGVAATNVSVVGCARRRRDLLIHSLDSDPNHAPAYNNLARLLGPRGLINFHGLHWSQKSLFKRAAELDPSNARFLMDLALALRAGENVQMTFVGIWDGTAEPTVPPAVVTVDQRALLERAVQLEHSNAAALCNLGVVLARSCSAESLAESAGASASSPRRRSRKLFEDAVVLDPSCAAALSNLGACLGPHERIRLRLRRTCPLVCGNDSPARLVLREDTGGKEDSFEESRKETHEENEGVYEEEEISRVGLLARALNLQGSLPSAETLCNMAAALLSEASAPTLVTAKFPTPRALLLQALEHDPSMAAAWCNLGLTIGPNPERDRARLADGGEVTRLAAFAQASLLDKTCSAALNNLGVTMSLDTQAAFLPNFEEEADGGYGSWSQEALFKRALFLDTSSASARCNVAAVAATRLSKLPLDAGADGGVAATAAKLRAFFVQAIELDPCLGAAFCNLASTLPAAFSQIRLADGSVWTQRALFIRAVESDPWLSASYRRLASTLGPRETVRLRGVRRSGGSVAAPEAEPEEWTRAELLERSSELDVMAGRGRRGRRNYRANEKNDPACGRIAISGGGGGADDWGSDHSFDGGTCKEKVAGECVDSKVAEDKDVGIVKAPLTAVGTMPTAVAAVGGADVGIPPPQTLPRAQTSVVSKVVRRGLDLGGSLLRGAEHVAMMG
eukprot:TRINITY_DN11747_c0_g1_i1.p1 TRINITY_DN11747_c0_g1~~TRINITY_DN11747_c0_g1_i1.p1  ORF type:complete len:1035 (-),score=202.34 TRINITY_DN11747_c0_g1_i1:26-2962(-)